MSKNLMLASDVRYRTIGDETIVVQQRSNRVLVLNAVAGEVLALLTEGIEEQRLLDQLGERFDVDEQELHRDMAEFLDQLRAAGLFADSE